MNIGYKVNKLDEHTWQIEETNHRLRVWMYLLEGTEKAVIIDTGIGNIPLGSIVKELTDLPVEVINTHYHGDHVGGNGDFEIVYLGAADRPGYEDTCLGGGPDAIPRPITENTIDLYDGDTFDLGGRTLQVFNTPGHSPGHMCILDVEHRVLYTGDCCCGAVELVLDKIAGLKGERDSLQRILGIGALFDVTRPAHDVFPVGKETIQRYIELADKILAGKQEYVKYDNAFFQGYGRAESAGIGFVFPVEE